ncbi:phage holin family protein [uncultured Varibaculum sp.]|uniref:phage holin family protein n=1 Tax=uncultured Varibaculum sp. TaxID=413896 RepID=UPI0027D96432|nr:phage holin family protein [uncultured Varibaculum sp.]
MSDSQRQVPPTPGYHSAPGTPPEHRATPGVPATPGYHSPQDGVSPQGSAGSQAGVNSTSNRGSETVPRYVSPQLTERENASDKATASKPAASAVAKTGSARPNLGNLVSKLSDQVQALVKGEIELAKVKAANMAKRSGLGIALLVVAGVLALYMLGFLFGAAAEALALVVPVWAAKLIVAAILLVLLLILALVGKASLQKGMSEKPDPQEGIKEGIAAVKKGLE